MCVYIYIDLNSKILEIKGFQKRRKNCFYATSVDYKS